MIPMTLGEVAEIVDGKLLDSDGSELVTGEAFIDSRSVVTGGIFIALVGERVDGHDFAVAAIRDGAAAAIVTRPVGVPAIQVRDAVAALQRLAFQVRRRLAGLKVIGITGSQGKTTTKDLLYAILSKVAATIAPPGSYNNELGAPLTLLRCSSETKFAIIEMGARHQGDIERLAEMAGVDVGAVLNIGSAHVGEFGSKEALASAKGELIHALGADGIAILGSYDDSTLRLRSHASSRVVTFGQKSDDSVWADQIVLSSGRPNFTIHHGAESTRVSLTYFGRHQVANALAATAIAVELGVPLFEIGKTLSEIEPASRWRMEVSDRQRDGVTIINDAYNANPESMSAAIDLLAEWAAEESRPTWAILGQMHELGASSAQAHQLIGRLVAQCRLDHLLVIGSGAAEILNGARDVGMVDVRFMPDMRAALEVLRGEIEPRALVLIKASRAEGLERLAQALAGGEK